MWPWEHLAAAYVLYSIVSRIVLGRPPKAWDTLAVVVGSQLPDLIDKPLAWTFGVTETGYSIGHSIFFATALCLVVFLVASRYGERVLAGAFTLAYVSHLGTDVYDPLRPNPTYEPRVVLWPLESPPADDHGGLLDHFGIYFLRYVDEILAGGLTPPVVMQLFLGGAVVVLWIVDGAPIAADAWRWLRTQLRA
ncbi:metal-dependent hydrolase [Natronorubrum daqingense]|uniref:LexA-binding, inner membrane-associated putative hydrolase n=1 Tax=Natronorubrum daqingense TaxID=588898 RepID=A0A1N6YJG6_9EURY|nr:metal-dependent hydrolase [Natronorubrum daqingense]APX95645.1 metal-dependent hydrolase [Natronorubrum daqingense]SIR14754.1 LexA-binding, inner membrane-associated putative hydrolase [Natronorubrum daqingense]